LILLVTGWSGPARRGRKPKKVEVCDHLDQQELQCCSIAPRSICPHRPATFVADLIRGHRHRTGSRRRRLPPGRQALLVLVYPPKQDRTSSIDHRSLLSISRRESRITDGSASDT
jgi:hypothetical protein